MIDFPSSPTLGQLYTAPNGVTYQWNGTLWLTNSAGGTGAVQAGAGTFTPATGADAVINFPTVVNGNSGNWLNPATGRYTPPPGRYFMQVTYGVQAPSGSNGTWTLVPRKNGVRIPNEGASGSGGPLFSIPITVGTYVDANGTDYFDWVANCGVASMAAQGGQFTAFPLSGMQGPPGGIASGAGDFWAYNSANLTPPANANTVMIANTVGSGNASGAYSPLNGRFTPPAGRYFIFSTCVAAAGGALQFFTVLRKNGVPIPGATSTETPSTANYFSTAKLNVLVDANGTDYFDVTINPNTGGSAVTFFNFGAVPLTGLIGPAGPAGPANPTNVLRGFLSGGIHSHPGGTQALTIGPVSAADSLNATWINSTATFTKSISTVWAAGAGAGGLGPGLAVAANTWYFPFAAIINGAFDIFFDTTPIPTHIPTGTTAYRRLRPIKTDGSSNILAHMGKADLVQWTAPIGEASQVSNYFNLVGCPPGIQTYWQGRNYVQAGTGGQAADVLTPGQTSAGYIESAQASGGVTASQGAAGALSILTDTTPRLYATWIGSITALSIVTYGFIDDCGRLD